jgi:hypothetical protein
MFANAKNLKRSSKQKDQIQALSENASIIYAGKLYPDKSIKKPKFFV